MTTWIAWVVLAVLLAAACAIDLRSRRIPNPLVVSGALLGLGLQVTLPAGRGLFDTSTPGAIGLSPAMLATVVLLLAGGLLWRLRLMGAGDAKLLAAVGPYVGPAGVLPVLLYTLLAGGVVALVTAWWNHQRALRAPRIPLTPPARAAAGTPGSPDAPDAPDESADASVPPAVAPSLQVPYALAIAAGVAGYVGPLLWAAAAAPTLPLSRTLP